MAATVTRRDREQTMSVILERSVEALGALSGTLHLFQPETSDYRLAHAVNVQYLDRLVTLPADDPVLQKTLSSVMPVIFEGDQVGLRWQALGVGPDHVIVGVGLGHQALLGLTWPNAKQAEHQLTALQGIQRYSLQVLAEFADLDARAADIQALSESLDHHERLTRTAAHDLSNKLAAAQALLDVACDSADFGGEAAELVKQAQEQVSLSQPLVDELSDPGHEIEREPLQVEELARLAAAMLARRRRGQDVVFTLEVAPNLPAFWGQRLAVLRVLDNLLSNALKHNMTRPELRVWLRVWAENNQVVFEVGDNGVGVANDSLLQLFEFGYRVDSTGKARGRGLGLWSSRRLVQALGGQIWAASLAGQATRFCFALASVSESPIADTAARVMVAPEVTEVIL
ncbi:MAG: sensor histidine kinase [Anaerolineales bacterium]|nr:sensor histidine kinase [Anaerolineales bacterium]